MRTLLVLALALLAPAAIADRPTTEMDPRTHRGADLDAVVADLAKKAASWPDSSRKRALMIWLVDNTPAMAAGGEHARLGETIARHFKDSQAQHAVVIIDKTLRLAQKITDDLDAVKAALEGVARAPENEVRDTMAAIAACVQGLRGSIPAVVLFTLENCDTENNLEPVARLLRSARARLFVISREGVYSDPYWPQRSHEANKHELLLAGSETPMIEFPWGILFQMRNPHDSVPAGYGIYGLNRLVALSDGAYYLYDPPSPDSTSYCGFIGCTLCGGQHKRCGALYDRFLLQQYDPAAEDRTTYRYQIQRSPVHTLVRQAWQDCYEQGILHSTPPRLSGSVTEDPSQQAGARRSYYYWGIEGLPQARDKALQDRKRLDGWIDKLAALPRPKQLDAFTRRSLAAADALRATLLVTRFNLGQLIELADYAPKAASGQPLSELEAPIVEPGDGQLAVTYYNVPFCHGTRAVRAVRWLGGKAADVELERTCLELDRLLESYQRSPWELVIRRLAVVRWHIFRPVTGIATKIPRRRESSDQDKPDTTTSPRPTRSRGTGSTAGSGGATTGN